LSEHARKRARAVLRGRDDGNIILLPDRSYLGWYRHITLVMLAQAFLTGICIEPLSVAAPATSPAGGRGASPPRALLPLTVPEVRHVLGCLIWPAPSSARSVLAWSWWRRCHRSHACYFHTKRRLEAG
jgi:hypothetical protein